MENIKLYEQKKFRPVTIDVSDSVKTKVNKSYILCVEAVGDAMRMTFTYNAVGHSEMLFLDENHSSVNDYMKDIRKALEEDVTAPEKCEEAKKNYESVLAKLNVTKEEIETKRDEEIPEEIRLAGSKYTSAEGRARGINPEEAKEAIGIFDEMAANAQDALGQLTSKMITKDRYSEILSGKAADIGKESFTLMQQYAKIHGDDRTMNGNGGYGAR